MSKKNTLLKLSALTAFLGGVFAFSDYAYKTSTVPRQHTDDSQDLDPAITKGRNFVRNHPRRRDEFIESQIIFASTPASFRLRKIPTIIVYLSTVSGITTNVTVFTPSTILKKAITA